VTCTLRHRLRLAATVLLLGLTLPMVAQAASQSAAASAGTGTRSLAPAAANLTTVSAGSLSAVTVSAGTVQPSAESQLLSLTNSARGASGLPALVSSSTLVSLARGWSAHMAAAHALSHNPSLAASVSGWYMIGENVAEAGSAAQAQSLFMSSSEHRANILEKLYNRVGIGVVRASDGTLWFTVDFEQTAGYQPPAPHQPVPHRPTPVRPAGHAGATVSATDRLLAARRAAAARANRSLVRAGVPTAGGPAPTDPGARAARMLSQEGNVDSLAGATLVPLGLGPRGDAGSGSARALLWVGAVAVLFVLASIAGQLLARREEG
jgi:uncharacterized protein YkwD